MLIFEKKIPLTKKEYDYLMELNNKITSSYFQTDYYYDSNKFEMNKLGIACLINEKNGAFRACIKALQENSDCSIEYSTVAINENDNCLFRDLDVKSQGYMTIYRSEFMSCNGAVIMFDKNYYLNYIDYELFIAYNPMYEEQIVRVIDFFNNVLCNANITAFQDNLKSRKNNTKSARFFERKAIIKNYGVNL